MIQRANNDNNKHKAIMINGNKVYCTVKNGVYAN